MDRVGLQPAIAQRRVLHVVQMEMRVDEGDVSHGGAASWSRMRSRPRRHIAPGAERRLVEAVPPMSRRQVLARTPAPARSRSTMASAAALAPRCSSIIAPDQIWPIGLAMFLPAMSGAEPCTGSNIEGKRRSGLRLAEGAMPIVPVTAGPRSDRMSPKRLLATTTSKLDGPAHEMGGQDVDVVLLGGDVGIVLRHGAEPLVPERHGVDDAVGFGGRGQLRFAARARQLEGDSS